MTSDESRSFSFRSIATIRTPFGEKFGTPRQPGLVTRAEGEILFESPFDDPAALRGLEGFSHLWLVFVFDRIENDGSSFRPTVRPPRLGGEERVGVFATRSTHRPNPIGLSLVQIEEIDPSAGRIRVSGVDLVDGTPILDVKPYLPWVEALPTARAGFAAGAPEPLEGVDFEDAALQALESRGSRYAAETQALLRELLVQDPRPAWDRKVDSGRRFAARVLNFDLRWEVDQNRARVIEIAYLSEDPK